MTFLIGLQGKKGVGKTTTANEIARIVFEKTDLVVGVRSFAEPVYKIASVLTGESIADTIANKANPYNEGDNVPDVFWGMTRRELLQKIGTDVFRESFHPDIWVSIAKHKAKDFDIVIFDDNRFQNEVDMLDLTVRLKRKSTSDGVGDSHSSENQSLTYAFECDLDKSTVADLVHEIVLRLEEKYGNE